MSKGMDQKREQSPAAYFAQTAQPQAMSSRDCLMVLVPLRDRDSSHVS
jgi:hypothetical protein